MAEEVSATLPLLSEKRFPHATASDLVAYCDLHDLVAIATDSHDVIVYRITGQPAYTVKRRNGEAEVTAVQWKQDGGVLAVGWNDGTYILYSGENGRLLSQGVVRGDGREREWRLDLAPDFGGDEGEDDEGGAVVARFGWTTHRPSRSKASGPDDSNKLDGLLTTEDWYDGADEESGEGPFKNGNARTDGRQAISKLTRSIATLDVTTVLPRLSVIPSHGLRSGPDGSKFSSQAATDSVFETQKDTSSDQVDAFLICASDGTTQVLQDDTVKIGSCNVSSKPVMHASHPDSATHAVLSQDVNGALYISFIDLPLDTLGGPLLHVIATNTKRIQNLLAYITQTVRCIQHDFATGLQFPTRLITNMNTELAEKQEGDVMLNLYHLAMTSDFSPTMLEWLVDIVKETNHKRWDQALNAMYTNVQNHIFINLLPALNRLAIAATALRGHARFHEGTDRFGVSPELFTKMLDGVDSLRLVAQKAQLVVMTEHRQFRAFSKWLRVMIEVGVAGPGTKGAIETEEREVPNLDYSLLLAYIKDTMTSSLLARHVAALPDLHGSCESRGEFFKHPVMAQMSCEQTIEALRRLNELKPDVEMEMNKVHHAECLLNLPAITTHLAGNARVAMERITEWQSKMLTPPSTIRIQDEAETVVLDIHVQPATMSPHQLTATLLLLQPARGITQLVAIFAAYSPQADGDSVSVGEAAVTDIGLDILDAKFRGEDRCLLLLRDETSAHFVASSMLPSQEEQAGGDKAGLRFFHTFPSDTGFRPEKLVVGGRPGKRVCLVFGSGGREWKALDLDAKQDAEEGAVSTDDFMDDEDVTMA